MPKDMFEQAAEKAKNSERVREAALKVAEGEEGADEQLREAFEEEYRNAPVATIVITDDNGEERTQEITTAQVQEALAIDASNKEIVKILESSYRIVAGYEKYRGGIVEIEADPPEVFFDTKSIPLEAFFKASVLRPGRYFVMVNGDVSDDWDEKELESLNRAALDNNGLLFAESADQIGGEADPIAVTIQPHPEADFEPLALWTTQNEGGEYLSLQDLMHGLFTLAIIKYIVENSNVETPDQIEEIAALAKQDTIKPRKQLDPNSKVANSMTEAGLYSKEGLWLNVAGLKENGEVLTAVSLNYEGEGVSITKQLTQFDREVCNAVTTLFVAGNKGVSIAQIWTQLSGSNEKPTAKQADAIRESMDKQRFTRIYIDYTQEARGRSLADVDGNLITRFVIDDYFLNATHGKIEAANGREVEGYVINRPPAIYQHSSILGQVISYPVRLLDTSSAGQNTSENIIIKKYLLRRIGMLKGKSGGRVSPRIKYESVYEKAGYHGEGSPDKKQRKRINDYVLKCMYIWQTEGHISDYAEYKEGRTRAGVEVFV